MGIVKQYQKKTDTTYVYSSDYYWDKDKKQSRSRRRLIGKIDKETGEVVPTGKQGRKKKKQSLQDENKANSDSAGAVQKLEDKVKEQKIEIISLRERINLLEKQIAELQTEKDELLKRNNRISRFSELIKEFESLTAEICKYLDDS